MLAELVLKVLPLYQKIAVIGSWRLGGCWEQILRSWLELAGENASGVCREAAAPISKDCFHRILEAGRLLGADSEVLAGAGWPEC